MTCFSTTPKAHQWNQSFINSKIGELSPPLVGEFKDGRGELFSQDTFNGRSVLVRAVWSNIEPDSHHFEDRIRTTEAKPGRRLSSPSWHEKKSARLRPLDH